MKLYSRLLIGASTLATSLVPLHAANAQDGETVIVDGNGSTGAIVHAGSTASVGNAERTTIFTNYYTEGGAGSGGGAGLGGVFFVDQGAALTLRNVGFISNTVKGGEGGSVATISLGNIALTLPTVEVDAKAITALGVTPTVESLNGSLVIIGATMSGANPMIGAGAAVAFGKAAGTGKIATIDGSKVTFAESIAIDPSAINAAALSQQAYAGGAPAAGTTSLTLKGDLNAGQVQAGMAVVGNGIAAGTTITKVTYDASNMATAIELSSGTTAAVSDLKVVAVTQFEASRFQVTGGNSIKPIGSLAGLSVGMAVTGDGFPAGTTITGIAGDGTITFSGDVTPGSSFKAGTQGAVVGSNTINLSAIRSDLAVGMEVSGTGIATGTRIIAINGTKVTLSNAIGGAAAASIADNTFVASFSKVIASNGSNLTLASVDGLKVGALLAGGGVPANAVITAINAATKTVSYRIDPAAAQLANGGSMNGITSGGAGYTGGNGRGGSSFDALLSDGEGRAGTNGYDGGNGFGGVGGKGGTGGSGSSGMPFNTGLTLAVASSTLAAINSTAEAVSSWADWSFATAVVKTAQVATDWANVAVNSISLGKWISDMSNGTVGLGGDGGAGGDGGDGSTFFGGGAGGDGGNGGDGALSFTDGGAGGDGGTGGAGGFGAGGGAGGSGGSGGSTGAAKDGGAGDGGSAGFGAGVGSDGDGEKGGGGSGFGGAIFVRSGGTLVIAGNALFQNNATLAGSSNNGGSAGNASGSDLFMMKGSNVTFSPGKGNTIRFEGTIADDSSASYGGAAYAAGAGAGLQIAGGGLVQLLGANTYTGTTSVGGGTLEAKDGIGLNANSHLTFNGAGTIGNLSTENGGVWLTGGTVVRRVGSLSHQLNWDGSGGFAAADAKGLMLNFGSLNGAPGQTLTWGQGGFVKDGSTLIFGSEYAQGAVTLANAVNLAGRTGRIAVFDNQAVKGDHALLAGAFTSGGLIVNDALYGGTAYFTAQNSLTSMTVNNGLVSTRFGESTGRLMNAVTGGWLTIAGGRVELYGAEKLTFADVYKGGQLAAFDKLTANWVNNGGDIAFHQDVRIDDLSNYGTAAFYGSLDNWWMYNGGDLLLGDGANTMYLQNRTGGTLMTLGDVTATSYAYNDGLWTMGGDLTTRDLYQHGTLAVLGDIVDGVEAAATRTITASNLWSSSDAVIGLGGLTGAVANTLQFDLAHDGEFAGVIDGAGHLVKTGAGKLLLSNANTFTGGLTIAQGGIETTLSGTLADTLAIDVQQPGTFIWGSEDAVASLINAGITRIYAFASLEEVTNSGLLDLNAPMAVSGTLANTDSGSVTIAQGAGAKLGQLANTGKLANGGDLLVLGAARNTAEGTMSLATGSTNRFGSFANAGTIASDAAILVNDAFGQSAGSVVSSADLAVGGNYSQTAGEVALGTTLQVGANLALSDASLKAGADVSVTGDFTTGSASFTTPASLVIGGAYTQAGGEADVGGNITVRSGLAVNGAVLAAGGTIVAGGDYVQASGSTTAGSNFGVARDVRLTDGVLAVAGDAVVEGSYVQTLGSTKARGLLQVGGSYAQTGGQTDVGGDVTIRSGLAVDGAMLAAGGAIVAGGDYTQADGMTTAGGGLGVGNNLRLDDGTLLVAKDALVTGNHAQMRGTLKAGGVLKVGGAYVQTGGEATVGGAVTVGSSLAVDGAVLNAGGPIMAGGDYTQGGGTTTTGGDLGVGGSLQLRDGALAVAGAATVIGSWDQQGATAQAGGTLEVGGSLALVGGVLNAGRDVLVTGNFASVDASFATPATLKVGGAYTQTGGEADVGNDVTVAANLSVTQGELTAGGAIIAGGDYLQTNGLTVAGTDLGVGGSLRLASGQLEVGGNAGVLGAYAQTGGSMDARGAFSLRGDYAQQGGSSTVGRTFDVGGRLTVAGATMAIGEAVTIGGDVAADATTFTATALTVGGGYAQRGGSTALTGGAEVRGTVSLADAGLTVGRNLRAGGFVQAGGSTAIDGGLGVGGSFALSGGKVQAGSDVIVSASYRQDAGSLAAAGNLQVGGSLTLNGGTVAVGGDIASGSLSGSGGSIVLAEGTAMAIEQTVNGTFAGSITGGNASVIKTGAATLTLAGAAGSFAPAQLFVTAGAVAVDGAGILDSALKVDIAAQAGLTLVKGKQTINNLSGFGTLALNGNDLHLANGGDFYGMVTGTGSVSLSSGSFGLSNSVDVQNGSFVVETGSALAVKQGGKLSATNVQVTGALDVAGTVTAGDAKVNGGVLHLGTGATGGMLNSKTLQVTDGGRLTGNGQVAGLTTIGGSSAGMLSPGNSPGTISFADLTLGSRSTTVAEIEGTAGAGAPGGHDLIAVSGTLTLEDGATLAIANSTSFEPALGQRVQIFDVAAGAVTGRFGTVTSAFANTVALNLSTGTVVGLGNAGGNGFIDAAATTANQQTMLDQLRVGTTGGVDQYRGGRLVEQVAGALASGNAAAVAATFDRASPEAYAGLADHQRLSMLNGLADLGGYTQLADRAVYATGSIAYDKARSRGEAGYARFRTRDTRFTVGFAAELALAKLQVSYTHSDGEVSASTLEGDAKGDIFAAGISAPVALDGGLRIMARVSHGEYRHDGDRITNGGAVSFAGVDGSSTVYGGGLEYLAASPRASLVASAEVLGVTSKVDAFVEGGALPLDALDVARQHDTTSVLRARVTGGYRLAPTWQAFAKLGLDQDLSDPLLAVTASVISEDAPFTVNNPGFTDTRVQIGAGTSVDITPGLRWNLEGDVGNASRVGARTSVTLRF